MRHMGANFHSQFKNKTLMKLFKRLYSQNQERKFNFLWKKLDELTKKETAELAKRLVNTEEDNRSYLKTWAWTVRMSGTKGEGQLRHSRSGLSTNQKRNELYYLMKEVLGTV